MIFPAERENTIVRCGLHDDALLGGLAQGWWHATMSPNLLIPMRKGEIKHARVGGQSIAMSRGGEVKSDSPYWESKGAEAAGDVEVGSYFLVRKKYWRELTCGSPIVGIVVMCFMMYNE